MVRWEPGTYERLQAAALDLYATDGFEQTTAADIAAAVGVSERTFFRHFGDKREVLFGRQDVFTASFTDAIAAAPADLPAIDVVAEAVLAAAGFFSQDRRDHSCQRQRVIDSNDALRERETLKMAALTQRLTESLAQRGTPATDAVLAAEAGVMVFRLAFERWVGDDDRPLAEIERELFTALYAVVAAATPPSPA